MEAIDSGRLDWIYAGDLADRGLTPGDLATLARILSRPCPHCGAEVGSWCRTNGGGCRSIGWTTNTFPTPAARWIASRRPPGRGRKR